MIPISAAPKRFAAALTKYNRSNNVSSRFKNSRLILQSYDGLKGLHQSASFSTSIDTLSNNFSTAVSRIKNIEEEDGNFHNYNRLREGRIQQTIHFNQQPAALKLQLTGPRLANWWTGKAPVYGECPGVTRGGKIHSIPQLSWGAPGQTAAKTKQALKRYFDNTWALTEVLFASLQGEEAFVRPPHHDLRHPMIFYYGHPAALYVNKLRVGGLLKAPINPYFESIFETGVDEMSWDDLSKNKMPWPSVDEVHAYRKQVYKVVSDVIANLSPEELEGLGMDSPLWSLVMAFEHERIHLETSSVLISELPVEFVKFPHGFAPYHPSLREEGVPAKPVESVDFPRNEMIAMAGGAVTIGKPRDYPTFGWDNEYGSKTAEIAPFRASKFKVSNGEFYKFVADGGYARRELWSDKGWEWRAFRNAKWPFFWQRDGPQGLHHFNLRQIFDVKPMQWSWPATVNYYEAAAFAKWKSLESKDGKVYRVITELEHKAIRDESQRHSGGEVKALPDPVVDATAERSTISNSNLAHSSMAPVDHHAPNTNGFHDVFGNAWEWTEDYFSALPGFQVHAHYEDFSTPCFDGLHHVIQGGSFISTGNEASLFSRFHFRPHFLQHSSFRLAEQEAGAPAITSDTDAPGPYVGAYPFRRSAAGSTKAAAAEQQGRQNVELSRQFGDLSDTYKSIINTSTTYSSRMTDLIEKLAAKSGIDLETSNALEVGCGYGALSFSLAQKRVRSVIGVDHSMDKVEYARSMLEESASSSYSLRADGDVVETKQINSFAVNSAKNMLSFRCSDPMSLPADFQNFDIVFLNDVIDKVSSPNAVLGRLSGVRGLIKPGGLLGITSCFEWNQQTTPRSLWLGGTSGARESEEELMNRLSADFTLQHSQREPFFWHESERDVRGRLFSVLFFVRK